MAADGRRPLAAGWAAADADGGDAAASAVLSGEYQALEMSAMVSALAHVVAGGDDDGYPPAAMAPAAGHYARAPPQQQWGSYPSAAAAPTPDHFFAAGEIFTLYYSILYGSISRARTLACMQVTGRNP